LEATIDVETPVITAMRLRAPIALGLLGCCVAAEPLQQVLGDGPGTPPAPFGDGTLEEFIKNALREWKTPGLAVAIVDGNSTWVKVRALT